VDENSFFRARSAFVGDWGIADFVGDLRVFTGEYWSFQSFIMSGAQKASMLGLWGVEGICWSFLGEVSVRLSGPARGVVKCASLETLRLFSDGELRQSVLIS